MIRFQKDSFVDTELYQDRLLKEPFIYMNYDKIKEDLPYHRLQFNSAGMYVMDLMARNTSGSFSTLSQDVIYNYLVNVEFCPESMLADRKKKQGYSLDADKKLTKLYSKGFAKEFIGAYIKYNSMKTVYGNLSGIEKKLEWHGDVDINGNQLQRLYYTANLRDNLRFYYRYNIVNIPKEYSSAIVAPQGKFLVWGDAAQSDLRIAINTILSTPEIKKFVHMYTDKYEGFIRAVFMTIGKDFDLDEFKANRDMYKMNCLAPLYGAESGVTDSETTFIKIINKFLDTLAPYSLFKQRIQDRITLGLPLDIESYFGFTQTIDVHMPGKSKIDILHKALNTPIQTGSSEVIILATNKILDRFYSLGYTEDDISIYYVRHDEPIFIVSESAMKDSWIFEDCADILVDDWTPIRLDFEFGNCYSVIDDNLMFRFRKSCTENKDKMTPLPEIDNNFSESNYCPVKGTVNMTIGTFSQDGKTVVAIVYTDRNEVDYLYFDKDDYDTVRGNIGAYLQGISNELKERGINGALVGTEIINANLFFDDVFFKVEAESCIEVNRAIAHAHYMMLRICEKYGFEFKGSKQTIATFKDIITRDKRIARKL